MLEIGLAAGASLRTWRRYFTRAVLVGIDIDPSCLRFADKQVEIRIGSQSDPEFLAKVVSEFPPTIVIDDGSHRTDDILFTFERLFPTLEPGGCYVIEDLWVHGPGAPVYLKDVVRGSGPASPFDVLMPLIQSILEKRRPDAAAPIMGSYLLKSVARVACVPGAVFLWKRSRSDATMEYINRTVALLDKANSNGSWLYMLDYIVDHQGPLDIAELAGRRAVATAPKHAHAHVRLGVVLELRGDLRGAFESVQRGISLESDPAVRAEYAKYCERLANRLSAT